MTRTYQVTGMSCSHCVARVKNALEKVHGVISASVNLQAQQAVVEMRKPIEIEVLQNAVASAGGYSLSGINLERMAK